MKNIFYLIFFLATTICNAQNLKKVKVSNSIEMNTKINEVWTTISNLENLDEMVPEIIEKTEIIGNGKGSIVSLTLKSNGLKVVEKVTKLSNKKFIFVYKMLETPLPIKSYKATIKITPLNATNYKVNFDAVFKVNTNDRDAMTTTINNFQKTLLNNIKNTYGYEK